MSLSISDLFILTSLIHISLETCKLIYKTDCFNDNKLLKKINYNIQIYNLLELVICVFPLYFGVIYIDKIKLIFKIAFIGFLIVLISHKILIKIFEQPKTLDNRNYRNKTEDTIFEKNNSLKCKPKNFVSSKQNNHHLEQNLYDPIDSVKFVIMTLVGIAIFAADFKLYNSPKCGKSMGKGLKLMDIGAGVFTYNAGIFSAKNNPKKSFAVGFKCFIFGLMRYITTFFSNVDKREFGVHWNFFFGLSILHFLQIIFFKKNKSWKLFAGGYFLCTLHQTFLFFFLEDMIIKNDHTGSFLMQNLEGISFIIPEFGMVMMCMYIGRIIFENNPQSGPNSKFFNSIRILIVNLILIASLAIAFQFDDCCRRTHNFIFVMVIMTLLTTHGIIFYFFNQILFLKNLTQFSRNNQIPENFRAKNISSKNTIIYKISRNALFILIICHIGIFLSQILKIRKIKTAFLIHAINLLYLTTVFYFIPNLFLNK